MEGNSRISEDNSFFVRIIEIRSRRWFNKSTALESLVEESECTQSSIKRTS